MSVAYLNGSEEHQNPREPQGSFEADSVEDKVFHPDAERNNPIAAITAMRWQRGSTLTTVSLSGLYDLSANELTEKIVPLLQLADGCMFVGPASLSDLDAVQDFCESAGYHLPVSDGILDVTQLSQLLSANAQATVLENSQPQIGPETSFDERTDARDDRELFDLAALLSQQFEECQRLPLITLQHLASLGHLVNHGLGHWFEELADWKLQTGSAPVPDTCDVIDQLAFTKPKAGNPSRSGESTLDHDVNRDRVETDGDSSSVTGNEQEDSVVTPGDPVRFLREDSPFAMALPGFQVRRGQLQMVEAVAEALQDGHHLLVEAGTGTGKSLAYLIPAALHAKATEDRVIVSTHTIALQDQISNRDFPLLQKSLGLPISLAVFKGRTHYVCMRKLHQELRTVSLVTPPEEVLTYMHLLIWLTGTREGNREELSGSPGLGSVWPRIQSETETCINKRCPFFKPCYYFRARQRAYEASVIITNHSLVFTDLKTDHHVLPHYDHLIFDEAHHLEQEATKHLGAEVGRFQFLSLLGRLTRDSGRHGVLSDLMTRLAGSDAVSVKAVPILEQLGDEVTLLRSVAEQAFSSLASLVPHGQTDFRITEAVTHSPSFSAIEENGRALEERTAVLEQLAGSLSEIAETEPDEDMSGRLFDATGFLAELTGKTRLLAAVGAASKDWVEWVEVSGSPERRQVVFHQAPIDVSKILRERLFEAKESVVLTSATLSVAGDFGYLEQRIGLATQKESQDEPPFEVESLTVPSPFDYSRQALLCVPTDVPDLSKMSAEDAAVWLSDSIYQLARISGGRLLTLFTSHAMLRATAEYLRRPLADRDLQLLAQGMDGNRTQLLRRFQEQPRSVLLGAQSFWEGIDLPGDQLTTLCIVRLPFTPPTHPVTAARNELTEAMGKSAFWHNSLPEAVVRFKQGFGRLIRTVDDKGVVVVFDKRVVTSRYGQQFIKSVPGLRTFVGKELDVLRTVKSFLG